MNRFAQKVRNLKNKEFITKFILFFSTLKYKNFAFIQLTWVSVGQGRELNRGWGSKFRTTKCRTADISKIRNFEY